MKLYYHKTDGGAEYYCLKHIEGCDEGDIKTAILRTDGNELEISTNLAHGNNIKIVIS